MEGRKRCDLTGECADLKSLHEIDVFRSLQVVIAKTEHRIYYFYKSIVFYNVMTQHFERIQMKKEHGTKAHSFLTNIHPNLYKNVE